MTTSALTHGTAGDALSPAPLMQLATGFYSFETFATAVELGLFTRLAGGRRVTVEELAAEFGFAHRPADLLLVACASLGLLEKDGDAYRNAPLAEEYLVAGRPAYFGGFVRFCEHREYLGWHKLIDALRGDRPVTWDPETQDSLFSDVDPVMLELFWEAMHSLSMSTAACLADAYDFAGHTRLLDVGGGSGAFPIVLCRRHPHLRATVYDLPHVCEQARQKIDAAGLGGKVTTQAGDFRDQRGLPEAHDVILLSNILHDWDERTGRDLLTACHRALVPGGVVLISELLLNSERTGPPAAALMGMNMLVETVGGKNYSGDELTSWLTDAGFHGVQIIEIDAAGANGVVVARKQ
ncbi:methyltransferase [Actinomadura sp. DC4]|uniref:methyltransferase n=1 Tax=Actinomadura sp. DC4 TaxID=3055069 RepID=UPI0025B13947|nr:methyltransferase [Actinomadura sp. DC4]MDN3358993.1 methyltransferase [Actinomadura sp. DC4]